MREIEFRAWYIEEKYMDYNPEIWGEDDKLNTGIERMRKGHESDTGKPIYILLEYTGVKDRDDRKVFEGDVIELDGWAPNIQTVVFNRGGFCLKMPNVTYLHDIKYAERGKVIGNVYENSELIK